LERQERQLQLDEVWRFLSGVKEQMQLDRDDFDAKVKRVFERFFDGRPQELVKHDMQTYRNETFGQSKHRDKAAHDEVHMDISGMVKEISDNLLKDKVQELVGQNLERIPGVGEMKRVNTELAKCRERLDEIESEIKGKAKSMGTKLNQCERSINDCVEENAVFKREISGWRTQVDKELKKSNEKWLSKETPNFHSPAKESLNFRSPAGKRGGL